MRKIKYIGKGKALLSYQTADFEKRPRDKRTTATVVVPFDKNHKVREIPDDAIISPEESKVFVDFVEAPKKQ